MDHASPPGHRRGAAGRRPHRHRGRPATRRLGGMSAAIGLAFGAGSGFAQQAATSLPPVQVEALSSALARTLQTPQVHDRLAAGGVEVSVAPPAAFAAFLRQQIDKYAALSRRTGITLD